MWLIVFYLCGMYFKLSGRTNPSTKKNDSYYRLVESYRNIEGRVCHRTILNVGFIEDQLTPEQLNLISRTLTDMYERKQSLFVQTDDIITKWVTELWARIVNGHRLDLTLYDEHSRMVNVETLEHSNVREIGSEWMCYNTWHKLGIDKILIDNGFSELEVQLAQTQVISRAVHPASELATATWIKENSAITELTGYPLEKMNKDRLYKSAIKLNEIKRELEQHLSIKTNELFDIQDKILLYDLTNTYFEGEKRNSKLAKYGRSKEKRSDCKLVVLAMVVNIYGFIKHSSIHEGNFSDSSDLDAIINNLAYTKGSSKPLVVLDAGIATEANLALILAKGYNYLCVSRVKLKDYVFDQSRLVVYLETKSNKEVVLKKVLTEKNTDYYLEVNSTMKAVKEQGMKTQFETRYEDELTKIKEALSKKGGIKQADKVNQRLGRAIQKYPSVANRYNLTLKHDESRKYITDITWEKDPTKEKEATGELGKYFIRTSVDMKDEVIVWNVYNTIREIESTFRTLKV
jgi:transposase